jgi:hypothetical protein
MPVANKTARSFDTTVFGGLSALFFVLISPSVKCCGADVEIHLKDDHVNEFSDREITRSFCIESSEPIAGRFVWALVANERTLERGEQELEIAEGRRDVSVKFHLAPLRDDVVLPTTLSLAVITGESEVARHTTELWFFADSPFDKRGEWLKSLDIRLFDPEQTTEETLRSASIPFNIVAQPAAIRAMKGGTLIVGSGVSMREYRSLADVTVAAAARGARVLWLSAADGTFPMEDLMSAGEVTFADSGIVQRFDKRFDHTTWGGKKSVATRLHLAATRNDVVAEIGDEGQSWLEARWPESNGSFNYCGFALVERWDDSPVPRNLLLRILERLEVEE